MRVRTLTTLMLSIAFVFAGLREGWAGDRIALVIGNGAYKTSPLKNPKNDAVDMATSLKSLGFEVQVITDGTLQQMETAIREFGVKLKQNKIGLFYYAGHGVQVSGENYLVPVDAQIESESDIKYKSVNAGLVLGKMEDAGNELNLVILDACRNNPFAKSFRSNESGLARMDAPKGSLVAYATAPGRVAADGGATGKNGLYTGYLLKHMQVAGLKIEETLKVVRMDVVAATANRQVPWESSSLIGDFYFKSKEFTQSVRAKDADTLQPEGSTSSGGLFSSLFGKHGTSKEDGGQPNSAQSQSSNAAPVLAPASNVSAQDSIYNEALVQYYKGNRQDAKKLYLKAAGMGHAMAAYSLGEMYKQGQGISQDDKEAAKWYGIGAERGVPEAQFKYAIMYELGVGVKKDYGQAALWYSRAVANGVVDAQYYLGVKYYDGLGVAKDLGKALELFKISANNGHPLAQYRLGVMYFQGIGTSRDDAEATKWLKLSTDSGNDLAAFLLGMMNYHGLGTEKNVTEAVRLLRISADSGNDEAQQNLGSFYLRGIGVSQSYSEAYRLYALAAGSGNAVAKCQLGSLYYNGDHVGKDYQEAFRLFSESAKSGYALAHYNIGVMYQKGIGVPQSFSDALRHYSVAANQNHDSAQLNIGIMHAAGQGVAKNLVAAYKWFALAAAQGNSGAIKARDMAASQMTSSQLTEAQRLASQWKKSTPEGLGFKADSNKSTFDKIANALY